MILNGFGLYFYLANNRSKTIDNVVTVAQSAMDRQSRNRAGDSHHGVTNPIAAQGYVIAELSDSLPNIGSVIVLAE